MYRVAGWQPPTKKSGVATLGDSGILPQELPILSSKESLIITALLPSRGADNSHFID